MKQSKNNLILYLFTIIIQILSFNFINPSLSQDSYEEVLEPSIKNTNNNEIKSEYLLDFGDQLYISFQDLNIFNNIYSINREGKLLLPEINEINASGKTLKEISSELTEKYKSFIKNPNITITIVNYRSVKIYLGGEVNRPGLYKLTTDNKNNLNNLAKNESRKLSLLNIPYKDSSLESPPRLFDALKKGNGITKFADLTKISVIRNNLKSQGGGKIKTNINLLKLLESGDQSQNIEIRDGDYIFINKSDKPINEQILAINKTNLTPDQIFVYVNGNVPLKGRVQLPQGSTISEAIAAAGGGLDLSGRVDFVRLSKNGKSIKKSFNVENLYFNKAENNLLLINGDILVVRKNILGKTTSLISEIATPLLSGYGLISIFD